MSAGVGVPGLGPVESWRIETVADAVRGIRVGVDATNLLSGGAQTHIVELLRAAQPHGAGVGEVVVWCRHRLALELPERPWLRVEVVPEKQRLWSTIHWQRELTRRARECADVLFLPGQLYLGGFRPYVAMSQNLLPFDPPERARYGWSRTGLRLRALAFLQGSTFRRADGMIFLTRTAQQTVESRTGTLRGPRVVIPHGIADAFFRPPRPQKPIAAWSRESPFRWLYVSAIELYKHQSLVARVVLRLRSEGLPVALDLVGPGFEPALGRLRATLARHDPNGAVVRYVGNVARVELPALNHQADGVIFASSCENLPNALLEAMAAGLPIACSNRSVLPEVLGSEGAYFDPQDEASLERTLRALLADAGLRTRTARAAFDRASGLTWRRCADETFGFIAQVADRCGAGRCRSTT